ncbi:transmembrane protein -like [Brachionus plicatilis]|uniref:Transmembrane protein-like n=1 Tax=Brachionus plicatilis TaxID=10195 RepID=A0A3M7PYD1_BRAPC|nr:transmembrane protein -like [Brachionus plicatilis]
MNDYREFENILQSSQDEQIRKKVVIIEYASIVLTILCLLSSGFLAFFDDSMTAMAVSGDSLLDILVHLIVLWRYYKPLNFNPKKMDKYASILLSILFFISSICIEYESIRNLITHTKPIPSLIFIAISIGQSITFSLLSIYKFYLAQNFTQSGALISSGIDSLVTGISNFSMALSMGIFVMNRRIWYLDSSFGIGIGLVIFIYGVYLLISVVTKD